MSSLLDKTNIPNHIAVIMDGNGRWAKKKGLDKKTPPRIKKKKGFIDREILKELEYDELYEDMLFNKDKKTDDGVIGDLIKKNVRALKKMASDNNVSIQELIYM